MNFSLYPAVENKSTRTSVFYGLDRTRRGAAGEMEDMRNMSSAEFPCAAPRGVREYISAAGENICAVCAPDASLSGDVSGFTGVADGHFYYNGAVKSKDTRLGTDHKWSVVRFGCLYVINGIRDKASVMYTYNTDTDTFSAAGTVMDKLIVTAGNDSGGNYLATIQYGYNYVREYSVTDKSGNVIANEDFFAKYSSGSSELPADNIFERYFSVGDEVSISGFPSQEDNVGQVWSYSTTTERILPQTALGYEENNTLDVDAYPDLSKLSVWQVTNAVVKKFLSQTRTVQGHTTYIHYIYFDLYNKNGDSVDFLETSGGAGTFYCSGLALSSRRRCFDNICAYQGRIWGTLPTGNMIYGSSSDDIFSFTASDILAKYAARVTSDTPGSFTAMCANGGELVLFKEDSITVLYGTNVSNYGTYVINGIGCIDARSVAATPYGVIFLSRRGFYCYSGGTPVCISDRVHTEYIGAVSGYEADIYCAAATKADGTRELLCCDMKRGLWHVHDDFEAEGIFGFRGDMYLTGEGALYKMTDDFTECPDWYFVTAQTCADTLDGKAVNEIWVRAEVSEGAMFTISTAADDSGFVIHSSFSETGLHLFRCPVRAVMGTSYRIRISGTGGVVIYDIEVKTAPGGRRHKEF